MTSTDAKGNAGPYNFGPTAERYEGWYATTLGKLQDLAQKADVVNFLECTGTGAGLLDVGCGTGHWSRFFATLGYTVVGVDISPEMIQEALGHGPHGITFHLADACALPFQDGVFEIIAAMAALEFMENPQQALEEMARCVRHGGRLLIGTLNRASPLNEKRIADGHEPYASGHLYTPDTVHELLAPFGTVRMVASEPLQVPAEIHVSASAGTSLTKNMKGPFIVAEVQR